MVPRFYIPSPSNSGYRPFDYAPTLKADVEEAHVETVRTVTVTMAPILSDLVTKLMAGHVNLDLVGALDTRDRLAKRLQRLAPDLILIGLRKNEGDEIGLSLLRLLPTAKVIAFSSDGRNAFVHKMEPQRTVLLSVSAEAFIDAILGS